MNPPPATRFIENIATIAPGADSLDLLAALDRAGATGFRVNLAHAAPEWLGPVLARVRSLATESGPKLPVWADLPGAKLRTGVLARPFPLLPGAIVRLGPIPIGSRGEEPSVPVDWAAFDRPPAAGDIVLLRDGGLELQVVGGSEGGARCRVVRGGEACSRMGVTLAGAEASRGAGIPLPEKLAACRQGRVSRFLLSFCDSAGDLSRAEDLLRATGISARLILPKIETRAGLERAGEILAAGAGCCLARGDLGTQIPRGEVAAAEIRLLGLARQMGKQVLVAGEVLPSLTAGKPPTRPELAAVYYALEHGAAGFILSDETAAGPDPAGAVETLTQLVAVWRENRPRPSG